MINGTKERLEINVVETKYVPGGGRQWRDHDNGIQDVVDKKQKVVYSMFRQPHEIPLPEANLIRSCSLFQHQRYYLM